MDCKELKNFYLVDAIANFWKEALCQFPEEENEEN
jgi:hypothetical protein